MRRASLAVTTFAVTTGSAEQSALAAGEETTSAWEAVRADSDIQFAPVALPQTPPAPDWLTRFLEFLGEMFAPLASFLTVNWSWIWPILAAVIGLLALYLLVRLVAPGLLHRRSAAQAQDTGWTADADDARALLAEADRLATAGRYDEATHLLLIRSVRQIGIALPGLVEPSSTAREIAALPALPGAARAAFSTIADGVERSIFALRSLSAEDWQAARAAYADFALTTPDRPAA